jgi:hypothetical protein
MTQRDDGGPAFPRPSMATDDGMTLRDWFAGQAMAGIMGNSGINHGIYPPDEAARNCYAIADAMLGARK